MSLPRSALLAVLLAVPALVTQPVAGAPPAERFPPPLVHPPLVVLGRHAFVLPDPEVVFVPNIGIVVGETGTLVVDTGVGPRNARAVLREVARVSANRRLYVTATHSHPDHLSGLAGFPAGTTFIASRALRDEAQADGPAGIEAMARLTPVMRGLLRDARLRPPDLVFEGEHRLDLGGVTVRLVSVGPAHSRGDTAVLVEGDGVLYAGDVVMNRRFPSVPPGGRIADWYRALDRLTALGPRTVVPGHGPLGDASIITAQRTMLQALERRVRVLRQSGLGAARVAAQVEREYRQRHPEWKATFPNEIPPIVAAMIDE